MPTSLSTRPDVAVLPSLPPSPSFLEEVFSHPRPWSIRRSEEYDLQDSRRSPSPWSTGSPTKGKGRQTLEVEDEDEDEGTRRGGSPHEAYPPITDEAAETRRVEETLKRWELAERQRRKSARESTQQSSGPSLLASVTRTASLVISRQTASIGAAVGPGTHAFKSHESVDVAREGYAVPLDDIDQSRGPSQDIAVHSPSPSALDRGSSLDTVSGAGTASGSRTSENPFVHPSERPHTPTLSPVTPTRVPSTPPSPTPFADASLQQALQASPTARFGTKHKINDGKRSSRSGASFFPPPRPLGLPSPQGKTPHTVSVQPTSQPILQPLRHGDPEEREDVRWWHEWLCGCGEGPDRGGDNQAGRTNPFE